MFLFTSVMGKSYLTWAGKKSFIYYEKRRNFWTASGLSLSNVMIVMRDFVFISVMIFIVTFS